MFLKKFLGVSLVAISLASCSTIDRLKTANEVAEYCNIYEPDKRAVQECTMVKSHSHQIHKTEFRENY